MGPVCLIAAAALAPFFVEFTPEVRTTYQSLGKIVEDRPMQIDNLRVGWDSGDYGRFYLKNWDVSSLSDRRRDVHRHELYHTEIGPMWDYDYRFDEAGKWRLNNMLTRSWTFYRGFSNGPSNKTYHWWQVEQALENPYVVPFYRFRRTFRSSDYIYFKAGARKKFPICDGVSVTPSVFAEGGNGRNFRRVLGPRVDGREWRSGGGISSVTFRLELAWKINETFTAFAFVEQYEVVGGEARSAQSAGPNKCGHNDWTYGGIGLRCKW